MAATNVQLGKFSNTARLFQLVNGMSDEKQFILLKTLLRQNISTYLFQLIVDMTEDQQTHLLDQLTEMSDDVLPPKTINLDDNESSMREHPRKPCLIKVICAVQSHTFKSYIIDISTVGVFIETSDNYSVGHTIKLAFALPGQKKPIKLAGKIAWKGLQGIGVEFEKLTTDQETKIRAYIDKR